MKTKIHSCARLFALFCMLSLSVTHAWAIDWASLGEAPAAGQYYIYNTIKQAFFAHSSGSTMVYTQDPYAATLFTLQAGDVTPISFMDGETTMYLTQYGNSAESTSSPKNVIIESAGNGNYYLHVTYTRNSRVYYLDGYSGMNLGTNYRYNNFQCREFVFISLETYNAQKKSLYYAATAEVNRGGAVKVSFENPIPEEATILATGNTTASFATSAEVTAFYEALPSDGYEFVGWKKSPIGDYVKSTLTYSESFDAVSPESASPTTFTMYAYFEKLSEDEAQLFNSEGELTAQGNFATVFSAATNNTTIVLLNDIDLSSTAYTINKNITLDFNNRTISGTVSNLLDITANVTFVDNSTQGAGGVSVKTRDASEIHAIKVTSGSLTINKGLIRCENTSDDAAAKAVGISVEGGTLNLMGGTVESKTVANAYGVKVNAGATANLTLGAISAEAASDACGVLANGITNVSWSVALNATTTTGDNAVGVLVNDASAIVTIDGGIIKAIANGANAYGFYIKQASREVAISGNMAVSATATGTPTTAYALKQEGSVVVNVETGRFKSNNTQDIIATTTSNLKLYGGYYVHRTALSSYKQSGVTQGDLQSGTKFYTEGYRYILTNGDNPNYVVATAFGTDFSKKFSSLEDAILYANNNPETEMTIRLEIEEYTLPIGNYTIPAKATLLVPYKKDQTPQTVVETYNTFITPSKFCKLILANGVHIDVQGTIELGGRSNASGQNDAANGATTEHYGYLYMENDSEIILSDGGELRAWGYVAGTGTVDVRRGATVRELFQILDWKGGSHTIDMLGGFFALLFGGVGNEGDVFPVNQYFIQNIELKTKYHPGSKLYTSTSTSVATANDIQIIGVYYGANDSRNDKAMFLMNNEDDSEDTWVQKWYNSTEDKQMYDVNNSAFLGNIVLSLGTYSMPSTEFTLPITNNMAIRIIDGSFGITQNTVMLPGAEIQIGKKAVAEIPSGISLFLYDKDQWDKFVFSGFYAQKIKYSPSIGGIPTARWSGTTGLKTNTLADASINVQGELLIKGAVYTTSSGANIYSTNNDAGRVSFKTNNAPSETSKVCQWNASASPKYVYQDCPSAKLKNSDDSFTETAGTVAGTSFKYVDGVWRDWEEADCMVIDKTDNSNWKYLAKPADYVELKSNTEDANHLYYSADETREFILTYDVNGNCQWWEVEDVEENDDLKHCIHPENDKYYYYDEDPDYETWLEKEFTVTWVTKPYDEEDKGEVVYNVDYKSAPKYLGTNPSRPMNDYYTYDFVGWTPELEPVTDDATYTAVFQQNDRKYMITFLDADGSVLEEALWKMGEVPVCKNQPTPSGKILAWSPTIRAVTGDATYTATYTDEEPSAYEITFVNWDGTTLKKADSETDAVYTVNVGEIPVYDGATPAKPAIADKAFEFDGWTPDVAAVSEAVVYTAKFREKPATYTVTFKRAVGDEGVAIEPAETIQTLENVAYGEMPVCTSAQLPTKTSTAAEYYTVVWTPTIAAVTGNATYTATGFAAHKNTCRLTVSAGANGKVALDGSEDVLSAVYEYGNTATVTATATTAGYRFVRWSDGNTANPRNVTVNAAITLKAEFAINQYTITWLDYDDSPLGTTTVNYGETPTHAVPARATAEGYSYTFNGWDPTVVTATADATYTATYTSKQLTYTIRIVLNNGMNDIVYNNMAYGQPVAMGTPVKASAGGVNYTFSHWTNSAGLNIGRTIPNVTNNEIYTAQYETSVTNLVAGNSDAAVTKDLILSDAGMEASALIIEKDGTVTIPTGASVAVQNFILESDGTKSGQLLGTSSARLTVAAHAYFDLTLNTQPRTWYAVAVPWEVDAENGIFIKGGRKLVLGRDFDLVYYNGANRATQGPGAQCWQYVEYETDKTMHPGRAYMMYFAPQITTVRFESKDLTIFDDDIQGVEPHAETTGNDGKDANWNGIGNPKVFHARLAAGGATYGYYLNNGKLDEYLQGEGAPTYKLINLASYTAIVGKPLFIQAVNNNSIVATATVAAGAPRRAPEAENYSSVEKAYEVTLHASGSTYEDNIFIQTAEQKEPHYVIGQDLVKAGVNAALPQLWVNRYDTRLAVNTTETVNGTYDYPLTLNIPQTGEYTISSRMSEGADLSQNTETLYLTINGSPVWNLSYGAYTATFEKGATTEYGLRIIGSNAPQITTGIGNVQSEDVQCTKVLRDGVIYILRGNNVYSIDGQLVK